MSAILVASAVVAAVGAIAGGVVSADQAVKNNRNSRIEAAKARRLAKQLEAFENSRQAVLDQSDDIRAMKDQVFNPMANLGVAMKSSEMQQQATDEALANTLNAINASGTLGAGGASALAKAAAESKAQIAAGLETQELSNQEARIKGEADVQASLLKLEGAALDAESAAYDRQETRDIAKMNRLSGLGDQANANSMAYEQQAAQNMMDVTAAVGELGAAGMSYASTKAGTTTEFGSWDDFKANPDAYNLAPETSKDEFAGLVAQGLFNKP